jgi:hypothetical protein
VSIREARSVRGETRHDTDVWPDDEKMALFYRRVSRTPFVDQKLTEVFIFPHRYA